jgi:hypothetical protein
LSLDVLTADGRLWSFYDSAAAPHLSTEDTRTMRYRDITPEALAGPGGHIRFGRESISMNYLGELEMGPTSDYMSPFVQSMVGWAQGRVNGAK